MIDQAFHFLFVQRLSSLHQLNASSSFHHHRPASFLLQLRVAISCARLLPIFYVLLEQVSASSHLPHHFTTLSLHFIWKCTPLLHLKALSLCPFFGGEACLTQPKWVTILVKVPFMHIFMSLYRRKLRPFDLSQSFFFIVIMQLMEYYLSIKTHRFIACCLFANANIKNCAPAFIHVLRMCKLVSAQNFHLYLFS